MRNILKQAIQSRILKRAGLIPIGEYDASDVFIAGYPKSGNTWFQNLVAGIGYGVDPEFASDELVQDLVPDVHYRTHYKRYQTPTCFKTHHLPKTEYRRVVYLLRDGRDVMVSYFHHLSALSGKAVDFFKMVREGRDLFPCKWHEHVEAWMANPHAAQMIVIKYEDLKSNPVIQLRRFCDFIGVKRDEETLERAVGQASFEMMRRKEITDGWSNPRWPKGKLFVRRGSVGSYKDEMPTEVLEVFVQEAEGTLHACGYL